MCDDHGAAASNGDNQQAQQMLQQMLQIPSQITQQALQAPSQIVQQMGLSD